MSDSTPNCPLCHSQGYVWREVYEGYQNLQKAESRALAAEQERDQLKAELQQAREAGSNLVEPFSVYDDARPNVFWIGTEGHNSMLQFCGSRRSARSIANRLNANTLASDSLAWIRQRGIQFANAHERHVNHQSEGLTELRAILERIVKEKK